MRTRRPSSCAMRAGAGWIPSTLQCTTPATFETLFPGTGGRCWRRSRRTAGGRFQRPGSRSRIPGLFLAGAACTRPGLPMAATSWLAAEAILAHPPPGLRSPGGPRRLRLVVSRRPEPRRRHGLVVIAFVGSVFSPYYARALRRDAATDPKAHCAINVPVPRRHAAVVDDRNAGRRRSNATPAGCASAEIRSPGTAATSSRGSTRSRCPGRAGSRRDPLAPARPRPSSFGARRHGPPPMVADRPDLRGRGRDERPGAALARARLPRQQPRRQAAGARFRDWHWARPHPGRQRHRRHLRRVPARRRTAGLALRADDGLPRPLRPPPRWTSHAADGVCNAAARCDSVRRPGHAAPLRGMDRSTRGRCSRRHWLGERVRAMHEPGPRPPRAGVGAHAAAVSDAAPRLGPAHPCGSVNRPCRRVGSGVTLLRHGRVRSWSRRFRRRSSTSCHAPGERHQESEDDLGAISGTPVPFIARLRRPMARRSRSRHPSCSKRSIVRDKRRAYAATSRRHRVGSGVRSQRVDEGRRWPAAAAAERRSLGPQCATRQHQPGRPAAGETTALPLTESRSRAVGPRGRFRDRDACRVDAGPAGERQNRPRPARRARTARRPRAASAARRRRVVAVDRAGRARRRGRGHLAIHARGRQSGPAPRPRPRRARCWTAAWQRRGRGPATAPHERAPISTAIMAPTVAGDARRVVLHLVQRLVAAAGGIPRETLDQRVGPGQRDGEAAHEVCHRPVLDLRRGPAGIDRRQALAQARRPPRPGRPGRRRHRRPMRQKA